jgi:hypothetical protein
VEEVELEQQVQMEDLIVVAGAGGAGSPNLISGSAVAYAGGGGGGADYFTGTSRSREDLVVEEQVEEFADQLEVEHSNATLGGGNGG